MDPLELKAILEKSSSFFFVDGYSRMMIFMYLRNKSEEFEKIKWYFSRVEKETAKRLKCLRSDKGGEFISNEFNNFYIERGIKR